MTESKKGLFITFVIILFIINMQLVRQAFSFSGEIFIFELLLVLFLGIMALDSMNEFTKRNFSCFSVLAVYFSIVLLNSAGLKIFANEGISLSLLFFAGLGFLLSTSNISPKKDQAEEIFKDAEKEVIDTAVPSEEKHVKAQYSPGKYLASKTGKKYHSPKCDFAKKIPKRNRVWLSSESEAKEKGYGPCKCI
jgi:predicted membrane protein